MALIILDQFVAGAKGYPDGSVGVQIQDTDTQQRYLLTFEKEQAIKFADRVKQEATGLHVAGADDIPKGGPSGPEQAAS
jgi:hypothetical protein